MVPMTVEKAIENAVASLRMEGLEVKPFYLDLCRQLLCGEITMEEYIKIVISRKGS